MSGAFAIWMVLVKVIDEQAPDSRTEADFATYKRACSQGCTSHARPLALTHPW
jgi:hypothetical protein